MGIREEKDMGEMDTYEEMRDAYLTGKIWNVGERNKLYFICTEDKRDAWRDCS